ncbi:hypothetical protein ACFX2I_003337 [Malus domestica]
MKVKAKNSREKLGLPTVFLVCSLFFFAGLFISTLLSHPSVPLFLSGSRPVYRTLESEDDEDHGPILQGDTGEWRRLYPVDSIPGFELETARSVFSEICNCGAVAKMKLRPSTLALRKGETAESTKGARTSASEDDSGVLDIIEENIARETMLPRTHGEAFNFLRYEIGQNYDSHYDAFNPTEYGQQKSQRNGAEMGMSYDYRKCIGLKIMPKQGDGLLFYSMFPNGTIDLIRSLKEASLSTLNSVNKSTSQIKKPSHRRSSPLNWFPRKKADSYLNRKIKMLQEVDAMNLTLHETLSDSNPHYSKVLREKMAAKEAAALVEASWCRILKAAKRLLGGLIQSKEAEARLLEVDKVEAEAFEEPNCPRKPCKIETSMVNGGGSTTHTVTASFEIAFEVDKEVAAAVKIALVRLGNCPSFDKDEFKELLQKISENPDADTVENNHESPEFTSECESELKSSVSER